MCVYVCVCVRACVFVCACVRACVSVCVYGSAFATLSTACLSGLYNAVTPRRGWENAARARYRPAFVPALTCASEY